MSVLSFPTASGTTLSWDDILNGIRRQEGVPSYGVNYLPADAPEDVGRSAASGVLLSWLQQGLSLSESLAKYGACGASSIPGQPCGTDYALRVLSFAQSSAGQGEGMGNTPVPDATAGGAGDCAWYDFTCRIQRSINWKSAAVVLLAIFFLIGGFVILALSGARTVVQVRKAVTP